MSKLEWHVEQSGLLQGASLHDGTLNGALVDDDLLWLFAVSYRGERRTIKLSGLELMNIVNFWKGSIIGEVWLWKKSDVPDRIWDQLFCGQVAGNDNPASLRKLTASVTSPLLFAIEASYGANVYAACNKMEIFDSNDLEELRGPVLSA